MGTLEKTLAEIEVLANEVTHGHVLLPYVDIDKSLELEKAIIGVENDARLAYIQCNETYRSLRDKNDISASSAFSQMALDLKNLADNLNIALQTIYGNYTGNLKALEQNTVTAPNTPEGKSIYQRFTETHSSSRNNPLMVARNCKGHNRGHNILFRTPAGSGWPKGKPYYLALPRENGNVTETRFLSEDSIQSLVMGYLEMTRDILQTVADNDSLGLAERKASRSLNTKIQRTKNFFKRHSKPLAIAAASVLLTAGAVGGSIGTVAYQNYQRQKELEKDTAMRNKVMDLRSGFENLTDYWQITDVQKCEEELLTKRKINLQQMLIKYPAYAPSYDLGKVFGISSNLFTETVGNLQRESTRLGVYVDNYLAHVPANRTNSIGLTKQFLDRRRKYISNLHVLVDSTKGKVPSSDSLETLEELTVEEKFLQSLESRIISSYSHLLPRD